MSIPDFSWLAKGIPIPEVPDPAEMYKQTITLADLARRNREGDLKERQNIELDKATKDAQAIYARSKEVGPEGAVKEALSQGRGQGAQLFLKIWKEEQGIDLENEAKKATAANQRALAASHGVDARNKTLEPHINRAYMVGRNPNATVEDVQAVVRDMPPEMMPTDVDFGDLTQAKSWAQRFGSGNYKAHEQTTDALTAGRNLDLKTDADARRVLERNRDANTDAYHRGMLGVAQQNAGTSALRVTSANDAAKLNAEDPEYKHAIEFYATQTLMGDNSWRTGLARTAQGSRMVMDVDKAAARMASTLKLAPEEIVAAKGETAGALKAMVDRSKFIAASDQFVNNFEKQAGIVERLAQTSAIDGMPVLNKWIQAGKKAVKGDPEVTAFDTAVRGLAREHQRIVTGVTSNAQLHVSAQETADALLNTSFTPSQVAATLAVMREEAHNARQAGIDELTTLRERIKSQSPQSQSKAKAEATTGPNMPPSDGWGPATRKQ